MAERLIKNRAQEACEYITKYLQTSHLDGACPSKAQFATVNLELKELRNAHFMVQAENSALRAHNEILRSYSVTASRLFSNHIAFIENKAPRTENYEAAMSRVASYLDVFEAKWRTWTPIHCETKDFENFFKFQAKFSDAFSFMMLGQNFYHF